MKFHEAMKALEEGKKVKRPFHVFSFINENGMRFASSNIYIDDLNASDWEVYEEPEQLLTFLQVVEGLKQGKSYTRKCWPDLPEFKIHLIEKKHFHTRTGDWDAWTLEDFEATDWIEVR